MRISAVVLKNFRNYANSEIRFPKQINLIVGRNGQGKTNLLEAIYFLSTSKSHRTHANADLIQHGEDWFYLKGSIASKRDELTTGFLTTQTVIEASAQKGNKKRFMLNGDALSKISEWIGQFKVVFFSPETLLIIKGAPADRRKFIDLLISQIDKNYLLNLQNYQHILRQRNKLLKQISQKQAIEDQLNVWDELISPPAVAISQQRQKIIDLLSKYAQIKQRELSDQHENLTVSYIPTVDLNAENSDQTSIFLDRLRQTRSRDLRHGTTTIGIHRDDFEVKLNGFPIRSFASQGQQRSAAIALKVAELEAIRHETNVTPVILLDDVWSELDKFRSKFLFRLFTNLNAQVFITTTEVENLDLHNREIQIFKIENGQVI